MAFAAVCALWFLAGVADAAGLLQVLAIPAVLGAAGTAGYTAYLFAQCEGRDLWQTPLLLPVLLAQAVTAGGAAYAILDLFMAVPEPAAIRWVLLGGVAATAALIAVELASHGSRHVELAIEAMTKGKYREQFWYGGIALGLVAPALFVIAALILGDGQAAAVFAAVAGVCALVGMFAYEDAFVRAGQSVPLS